MGSLLGCIEYGASTLILCARVGVVHLIVLKLGLACLARFKSRKCAYRAGIFVASLGLDTLEDTHVIESTSRHGATMVLYKVVEKFVRPHIDLVTRPLMAADNLLALV